MTTLRRNYSGQVRSAFAWEGRRGGVQKKAEEKFAVLLVRQSPSIQTMFAPRPGQGISGNVFRTKPLSRTVRLSDIGLESIAVP